MPGITGLIGSFYGSDEDLYGRRPTVPDFPNYIDELRKTISGNISLVPSLTELATKSTELYSKMMETAYPGITGLKKTGTQQIQSMLSGEIPKDVMRNLKQYAAESATSTGTSGSSFATNNLMRSLGLSSLDLVSKGLSSAERWINQAQSQTFDFSKMFLGPQDAIRQSEGRWQRDWLSEQVKAAPDPTARGAFDSEMALIGMALSAYGGGAGYTGQYKPQYGGGGGGGGGPQQNSDGGDSFFVRTPYYQSDAMNPKDYYSGREYNVDNLKDYSNYA